MNVARRSYMLRKRLEKKYVRKLARKGISPYKLKDMSVPKDGLHYERGAHAHIT